MFHIAIIEDNFRECYFIKPIKDINYSALYTVLKTHIDTNSYGINQYKIKKINEHDNSLEYYTKSYLTEDRVFEIIVQTFNCLLKRSL